MHNILKYVRRTIIWGIIFQNKWKRCIIFHTDHIFLHRNRNWNFWHRLRSVWHHILTSFSFFFLCVCEFNVYNRNSFELKLFFSKIIEFFSSHFCFYLQCNKDFCSNGIAHIKRKSRLRISLNRSVSGYP